MTRRGSILFVMAAWCCWLGLNPTDGRAQEPATRQVELLRADSLTEGMSSGQRVRNLIGNVRLRQDSTLLSARRVRQFVERDQYLFVGDVLIVEQGDSLRADSVHYDRRSKVGLATGSVQLTDGEVVVLAPSARYFVDEKRAQFEAGVTLIDSLTTLISRTGTYWSDEKRAAFADSVRLYDEHSYLEADSITHLRETEVSHARGDVFVVQIGTEETGAEPDSSVRTLLFGEDVYNDAQASLSQVRGQPLMLQIRSDSTGVPSDTLIIRAGYLESVERDMFQRLIATDSVRVWQRDLAAVADSLVLDRFDADSTAQQSRGLEEVRLFVDPGLWAQGSEITGDTIRVVSREGTLDSLFVRTDAFVAQRDSLSGRLHQMRGQHLTGVFQDDSTRTFTIAPTAEAIYQLKDDEDQPDGAVRLSGDRLVFRIRGDQAEKVDMSGEPTGTLYTEALVPSPLQLPGFRWNPEAQPRKELLLARPNVQRRLLRSPSVPSEETDAAPALPTPASGSIETDI